MVGADSTNLCPYVMLPYLFNRFFGGWGRGGHFNHKKKQDYKKKIKVTMKDIAIKGFSIERLNPILGRPPILNNDWMRFF